MSSARVVLGQTTLRSRRAAEFWGSGAFQRRFGDFLFQIIDGTATADEVEPHVHEEAHFIFVIRGNYVSSAHGAPTVACTPILIDNPAGTAHRDHFLGPGGRFLAISAPGLPSAEGRPKATRASGCISALLKLAEEMPRAESPLPADEIATLLFQRGATDDVGRVRPSWLDRAYEAVMEEPPDRLSIARLSAEADVHPAHLSRLFRSQFGRPAGEILRARQIERACGMLLDARIPIAGIAHDLGFADQAHFTHMFRRRTGCTPGAWRRAARGGSSKTTRSGNSFR